MQLHQLLKQPLNPVFLQLEHIQTLPEDGNLLGLIVLSFDLLAKIGRLLQEEYGLLVEHGLRLLQTIEELLYSLALLAEVVVNHNKGLVLLPYAHLLLILLSLLHSEEDLNAPSPYPPALHINRVVCLFISILLFSADQP
jgi:hypothetical protein